MTRAGAKFALVLVAAGGLVWGCASNNAAVREHAWQTYEPDGGWNDYVPPTRTFEPSAARATANSLTPQLSPSSVTAGSVALPTIGH